MNIIEIYGLVALLYIYYIIDNAGNFDKEWNEMRHKLKFDSGMSGRALPFAKAGHQKSSEYRSGNYNDREKGYFMDDRFKRENNPVPYRNR